MLPSDEIKSVVLISGADRCGIFAENPVPYSHTAYLLYFALDGITVKQKLKHCNVCKIKDCSEKADDLTLTI